MKEAIHHRTIRTFSRRIGRITAGQSQALELQWKHYGIPRNSEKISVENIFGNKQPLIVEIGFGMGDSLIHLASQTPEKNFIGIEVHRPGIGRVLAEIELKKISNLRVMEGDALEILREQFLDHSLMGLNLFFPDPWPKTRHHKRRMVQSSFLELLAQKLSPGGIFHAATDWQPYAEVMMRECSQSSDFINVFGAGNYAPDPQGRPETKFERRGRGLGHGVWDVCFRRSS